jgi:hypothetical protein
VEEECGEAYVDDGCGGVCVEDGYGEACVEEECGAMCVWRRDVEGCVCGGGMQRVCVCVEMGTGSIHTA